MTSPAIIALSLALACSIIGTASEQTADYDSAGIARASQNQYKGMRELDVDMRSWTNVYTPIEHTHYDENNYEIYSKGKVADKYDEIYTDGENAIARNFHIHKLNLQRFENMRTLRQYDESKMPVKRRVKRDEDDARCEYFMYNEKQPDRITHPHAKNSSSYYNSSNCVTVINATEGQIIELTFVDIFRIEYHPECAYDYLEIRDGLHGYSKLLGKLCGQAFPQKISTTGPNAWLKFKSDDTIEYDGFHIDIKFSSAPSHSIPESCYKTLTGMYGLIDSSQIDPNCVSGSAGQALDVLWTIESPENTKIYLNFTDYSLAKPNECEENVIEIFGSVLELSAELTHYCGSMANSVNTKGSDIKGNSGKDDNGNIMYVRLYASKSAKEKTSFKAKFTAYRSLDPNKDEKCTDTEFDCEDNTCIDRKLRCDNYANCRLKADEDQDECKGEAESMIEKPHILVILVIFSLILSGMSFVFLFKCIRKLYQDHKIIKEHIRQSCEDRLDSLLERRLTLDAERLQRDSQPRASLERENHTNEMFNREHNQQTQQRKYSKRTPTSIESDFIQDTQIDLEDQPWRRDVDAPIKAEDIRIERNGRSRHSDMSKKEESIRSKLKEIEEHSSSREKKEIRDVSVGAPDTKESGCQTRESLFQTETAPSSDGSGTNSRGFSTFGYSGATIVRPSPPAQTNTSEITIELLRQMPRQESVKPQKKQSDRRPISTETTRSAPDVIIVSKPIR